MRSDRVPDQPLQPGDCAPSFQLPAVNRDGVVSLDNYWGRCPVMVGLFKGLHCPFCRRHIARLAVAKDKLAEQGVETVVIVNTQLERARQYFRYRPTQVELASDPEVRTHRAFGVSAVVILPDAADPAELQWPKTATVAQLMSLSINPDGALAHSMSPMAASELLNKQDGFEMTDIDRQIFSAHGTQFNSQFLIDATGVIRWSYVEAQGGPDELCRMPGEDEMIVAAKAVR